MSIENVIFTDFYLFLALFLKNLYTCGFPLKLVLLNEFAKQGDTFESCHHMEMYQLKDKFFILFYVTFKLCKIQSSVRFGKTYILWKMKEVLKM